MHKERGTIKWNAMMLPEHVARLRTLQEPIRPKEWSEWELEDLHRLVAQQRPLQITYIYNGKLTTVRGIATLATGGIRVNGQTIAFEHIQAAVADD